MPPINEHSSAHRHELRRAAGECKNRRGVWVTDGSRPRNVDPKPREVSILPNFERSDARVDSERAGAAYCRQLKRLMRAERVVPAGGGTMNEDGEPSFVENIHAIVACHRIRAHADANSGGYERQERRDAVSELRVRRRTVRHRTAVTCHNLDVGIVNAYTMNE
jgi:hypothetical protein